MSNTNVIWHDNTPPWNEAGVSISFNLTLDQMRDWRSWFEMDKAGTYEYRPIEENKVAAIKRFREDYFVGLKDAKEIVEMLIAYPDCQAVLRGLINQRFALHPQREEINKDMQRYQRWIDDACLSSSSSFSDEEAVENRNDLLSFLSDRISSSENDLRSLSADEDDLTERINQLEDMREEVRDRYDLRLEMLSETYVRSSTDIKLWNIGDRE